MKIDIWRDKKSYKRRTETDRLRSEIVNSITFSERKKLAYEILKLPKKEITKEILIFLFKSLGGADELEEIHFMILEKLCKFPALTSSEIKGIREFYLGMKKNYSEENLSDDYYFLTNYLVYYPKKVSDNAFL